MTGKVPLTSDHISANPFSSNKCVNDSGGEDGVIMARSVYASVICFLLSLSAFLVISFSPFLLLARITGIHVKKDKEIFEEWESLK